jgi:hypothetical protein
MESLTRKRRVDAEGRAFKGSQRLLQTYVNERTHELDAALRAAIPGLARASVEWQSPLRRDSYKEYRDADFLARTGASHLAERLESFWPRRGPVWDGLATTALDGRTGVLLVEAKSYPAEMTSSCRATPGSRARIEESLAAARAGLAARGNPSAWTSGYYQLANRMAHAWWLREQGIDAHLVLVCFTGDHDERAWRGASRTALRALGLADARPQWLVDVLLPSD